MVEGLVFVIPAPGMTKLSSALRTPGKILLQFGTKFSTHLTSASIFGKSKVSSLERNWA